MAIMEGPLSKWTNVMNGWQYRWFVLDENAGLLSYYTSKEKMMRGARRGCVRLKGAVIGIDDEDDSTYTITVDQKTFHFQARDSEEKEKWIDALEATIVRHSHNSRRCEGQNGPTMGDFEKKLSEADAYLQILIDQAKDMEKKIDQTETDVSKEKYISIKETTESMIESIKQSIVLLQIAKAQSPVVPQPAVDAVSLSSLTGDGAGEAEVSDRASGQYGLWSRSEEYITGSGPSPSHKPVSQSLPNLLTTKHRVYPVSEDTSDTEVAATEDVERPLSRETSSTLLHSQPVSTPSAPTTTTASGTPPPTTGVLLSPVPDTSYSSSEDECFFDAEDGGPRANGRNKTGEKKSSKELVESITPPPMIASKDDYFDEYPRMIASKDDYFDELYDDNDEEELESLDQHGSIITHLLSQVRIGMDLTKIVLPTFILEKRSLLEMFADFLAHPDLFVGICEKKTPRDRMVHCVRWYLSAFHAGRRSQVAKKPYNPILGETFQCYYDLPGQGAAQQDSELNTEGPVPGTTKNNVSFIAEQVSHHPPISAFYAEHFNNRISLDGYIWTKSKFLGLSIGVHMIGQGVISVLDYGEEYTITFPNGYGRSILTVPWVELGGKCQVSCAKTGYSATIDFHTKPFYGGKKDQITAEIYAPNEKKSFCTVKGEWNGVMWAKYTSGFNEKFVDTKSMPIVKKRVRPIEQQEEYESRRLWEQVTYNLKNKNIQEATSNKHRLEQRQREEAKQRKEAGVKWETKRFHEVGEHWVYDRPLMKRLTVDPKLQD